MSEQERIQEMVDKWGWVIGGIVDNETEFIRAIILDYLELPIENQWILKETQRHNDVSQGKR